MKVFHSTFPLTYIGFTNIVNHGSSLLLFTLYYLVLSFASFFGFTGVLTLSEVLELGVVVLIALVLILIVLVCLPVFIISISKVVLLCVELVWLLLWMSMVASVVKVSQRVPVLAQFHAVVSQAFSWWMFYGLVQLVAGGHLASLLLLLKLRLLNEMALTADQPLSVFWERLSIVHLRSEKKVFMLVFVGCPARVLLDLLLVLSEYVFVGSHDYYGYWDVIDWAQGILVADALVLHEELGNVRDLEKLPGYARAEAVGHALVLWRDE